MVEIEKKTSEHLKSKETKGKKKAAPKPLILLISRCMEKRAILIHFHAVFLGQIVVNFSIPPLHPRHI